MAETHESLFYETMWRCGRSRTYPLPWWCQQYFRAWSDEYDAGLFASKEGAFASNAHYRYWHMVGVKDHNLETLIGQAGEVEPVYDRYALGFFVFDPASSAVHLPQFPAAVAGGRALRQEHERGDLPILHTHYQTPLGIEVHEEVHATVLGAEHRSVVLVRFRLSAPAGSAAARFGVSVTPAGPSGFQRHDKAGRYTSDTRISYLHWNRAQNLVELNATWGPIFRTAPHAFGVYAQVSRSPGASEMWDVALGAWNEQHCYPVAKNFAERPNRWWYMGDIPHGWACAELLLLLRDCLFFEAAEDGDDPHLWIAPGVMPDWLNARATVGVRDATTIFGGPFGYTLELDRAASTFELRILQAPPRPIRYAFNCRWGAIASALGDAGPISVVGTTLWLPRGTTRATIRYV